MANRDKLLETERKEKSRREKRLDRRQSRRHSNINSTSSSSESEASASMPQANGTSSSSPPSARDNRQDDALSRLSSVNKTLELLSLIVPTLEYPRDGVTRVTDIFQPEIDIMTENRELRASLDHFQQVFANQEVKNLQAQCAALEAKLADQGNWQRKAEQMEQDMASKRARMEERWTSEQKRNEEKLTSEREKTKTEKAKLRKTLEEQFDKDKKKCQADLQKRLDKAEEYIKTLEKANHELEEKKKSTSEKLKTFEVNNRALVLHNNGLESQVKNLEADLQKEQLKLHVDSKELRFYQDKFEELRQELEKLTSDYITGPMNHDQILSVESLEKHAFFKFVPKQTTDVGHYLWKCGAHSYIVSQLCGSVWQSFPCQSKTTLEAISEKIGAEQEPMWRNITYEALNKLSADTGSGEIEQMHMAKQITDTLAPIIDPANKPLFETRLAKIVREASDVWTAARTDRLRISISQEPPSRASPGQFWRPAASPDLGSPPDMPSPEDVKSLCLFPAVKARNKAPNEEEDIVVNAGYALFSDSPAFALGHSEQEECAREIRRYMYARRRSSTTSQATTAVSSSPRSPTFDVASVLADKKAVSVTS